MKTLFHIASITRGNPEDTFLREYFDKELWDGQLAAENNYNETRTLT
jgi:hypothetical protein